MVVLEQVVMVVQDNKFQQHSKIPTQLMIQMLSGLLLVAVVVDTMVFLLQPLQELVQLVVVALAEQ